MGLLDWLPMQTLGSSGRERGLLRGGGDPLPSHFSLLLSLCADLLQVGSGFWILLGLTSTCCCLLSPFFVKLSRESQQIRLRLLVTFDLWSALVKLNYNGPNNLTILTPSNCFFRKIQHQSSKSRVAGVPVTSESRLWRRLSWRPLQAARPCRLDHCCGSILLLIIFSPASLKKDLNPYNRLCYPQIEKNLLACSSRWNFQWKGTCIIVVASRLCRKCNLIKQVRNHRCRMMMRRITSLVRVSRSSCLSFSLRNTWVWKRAYDLLMWGVLCLHQSS